MLKSVLPAGLFATAMLLGTLACGPAFAASQPSSMMTGPEDMSQTGPGTVVPSSSGKSASGMKSHGPGAMSAQVEQRISTLHAKLKITPEQESEWNDVAQAMRDNEQNIGQLIQSRKQNAASMNAVDDLASYQKITQAHADGMTKVVSSFQSLYDDMSPAQQKNADEVFGKFEGHRGVEKTGAKKSAPSSSSAPAND